MNPAFSKPFPDAAGPRYWRSLDQMADTPAFRKWVEQEFPQAYREVQDPVSRRHFAKIMSASFLLAGLGLTGCRRPEETIHPFSKMPENYTHGVPVDYATAFPLRRSAQALLVKSIDGRPIKIEGNPRHPLGLGGTHRLAQASILGLYDPDRALRYACDGKDIPREQALGELAQVAGAAAASQGAGLCFLLDQSSSPSRMRLQRALAERLPKARWYEHEPLDASIHRTAAALAHPASRPNTAVVPCPRLDNAKVLLSLDHDFLGAEDDAARHIRDFARSRAVAGPESVPSRLYVVEALMSLTGATADHRLRVSCAQVGAVAARLAAEVLAQAAPTEGAGIIGALAAVPLPAGTSKEWIRACAADLLAHQGASLVLAGTRQPLAVHLLALAMNKALGNEGATLDFQLQDTFPAGSLEALAQALRAGEVKTLVICGANPAYAAPADLDWPALQRQAGQVLRLGAYEDETAALSRWHFPAAHALESWGDARTTFGVWVPVQPLIAPLFEGLTDLEFLARAGGLEPFNPHDIVRATTKERFPTGDFERFWPSYLREGFLPYSDDLPADAPFNWAEVTREISGSAPALAEAASPAAAGSLEVIFHPDLSVDDGRFNNNGWLQELPDPITKVTWENVLTLSPKTARALGVWYLNPERGPLQAPTLTVELEGRKIEGPVWIQPGQADGTIGLALGYGRTHTGRVGRGSGYNAYALRTTARPHFAAGARASATGRQHPVSTPQDHWAMEGRPIVREASLEHFRQHPDFVHHLDLDAHEPKADPIYPHPHAKHPEMKGQHQWGMAVDLNTCVGCSSCVIACQSENNIPIVGKDQVSRGREMHWIRVDRYYAVRPDDEDLASPQVLHQPMFCQHCENAPCESVCPVNATVHDEEGLNLMVYNRCVGTRYCSNNCPYKVRRFNYFDFNQRPLDKLYLGPLAPKGMPDLVQMVKNPDVTVRMRGVMEKCTFCLQRIEQAKINQKIAARDSNNVRVPDGTITTACAQACPAGAIVFGDISDPASQVSQIKRQSRNYGVLGFLNTRPRATYLARIRNPHPDMPDTASQPLTLEEKQRHYGTHTPAGHGPENHEAAGPKGGH